MALSLKQARVCLDCDCLTDQAPAPCATGTARSRSPAGSGRSTSARPSAARRGATRAAPPPAWILIVQHQQRDLYRVLRQALDGTGVEVLYERRVGQRRRIAAGPAAEEQRRTDRRRPRPSATVYQEPARPRAREPARAGSEREAVPVVRPRRRQPARSSPRYGPPPAPGLRPSPTRPAPPRARARASGAGRRA